MCVHFEIMRCVPTHDIQRHRIKILRAIPIRLNRDVFVECLICFAIFCLRRSINFLSPPLDAFGCFDGFQVNFVTSKKGDVLKFLSIRVSFYEPMRLTTSFFLQGLIRADVFFRDSNADIY